ncbi:bolA-like protein 2 isoform X3 [Planococcus citri]|uniref:bolA-like protein 2 isoform X3 n=1 Tax=Planococcus citri TaxID=170843 RepID=UPI0031F80DB6
MKQFGLFKNVICFSIMSVYCLMELPYSLEDNLWDPGRPSKLEIAVREKLTEQLQPEHLEIIDKSSFECGAIFDAVIVSAKFEGLSILKQQKLVFDVLKEEMKNIHAFSMKTMTPAEYKESVASSSTLAS